MKNKFYIKNLILSHFHLIAYFVLVSTLLITIVACATGNPVKPTTAQSTPPNSNIIIESNQITVILPENTVTNFPVNINIMAMYEIDSNYISSNVFVHHLQGVDALNLAAISLEIDLTNFIVSNINITARLDYENPTDANTDNMYELATFLITNVDGGSNSFSLLLSIFDVGEDIAIENNQVTLMLPENAVANIPVNINIMDMYEIDINYNPNDVFIHYLEGVDVSNLDALSLEIDLTNFIVSNINVTAGLDYEKSTDANTDNIYELATFLITNVDGGSNSFSLQLSITDLAILHSNTASYTVGVHTSNIIDISELILDDSDASTYTYQLIGTDAAHFELGGDFIKTAETFGFSNIFINDGQYNFQVNYVPVGAATETLSVTVNVDALWVEVTNEAAFGGRSAFQSVVLANDDILVMGGFGSGRGFSSSVLLSSDGGLNWNLIASNAWNARVDFQTVVLAGNVLLMGGQDNFFSLVNDVWLSSDGGTNWSEITNSAPWSGRSGFQTVVLMGNDLLLMGGSVGTSHFNDVWLSSDGGTNWSEITNSAPWSGRSGFQTVVLMGNDLLLMGGSDGTSDLNDVWLSSDGGTNWSQITASATWSVRTGFQTVVLAGNDLLLMGGSDGTSRLNDVWFSSDGGTNWSQITATAPWRVRVDFQAVTLSNRGTLVIGGLDVDALDDVWLREEYNRHY